MSFGFSVTDFKEIIKLSWNLYESLKDSPHEIRDLAKDFTTIYGVLTHIEHDLEAGKESATRGRGEAGMKMLQTMTLQLKGTTVEVQNSSLRRIEEGLESMRISATAADEGEQASAANKRQRESLPEVENESDSSPDAEDETELPSEPRTFSVRLPPSSSQQEQQRPLLEVPIEETPPNIECPAWLNPKGATASLDFKRNLSVLDPCMHDELPQVIFSNCRFACFQFYRANGLWRTKYGNNDSLSDPNLFQLDDGGFPKSMEDLSLRDWLLKIQRAYNRINEVDAVQASDIYDFLGSQKQGLFAGLTRILLVCNYQGGLDMDRAEESLMLSLSLCRHLNGWDSFGRLNVLWKELHRRSVDFEATGIELDMRDLIFG